MKKGARKTKPTMERTSVSLPTNLLEQGQAKAKTVRPFTFSNYVATLIERDVKAGK